MNNRSKVFYSINIEDIQEVAREELERELKDREVELVTKRVGDYIDWYEAINLAIESEIE